MLLTALVDAVRMAAEDAVPFEACGLITDSGALVKCENVAKDRARQFCISPDEYRRAAKRMKIVGVYHSHVNGGAYVSVHDRDGMGFAGLYVVASVMHGVGREVKVWNHKDGKFTPVTIPGQGKDNGQQT